MEAQCVACEVLPYPWMNVSPYRGKIIVLQLLRSFPPPVFFFFLNGEGGVGGRGKKETLPLGKYNVQIYIVALTEHFLGSIQN